MDLTQQQLAEKVGVTRQTISLIEKGNYNPTLKLCLEICYAVNKSLDEVFLDWQGGSRWMKKIKDERLIIQNLKNIRIAFIVQTIGISAILIYEVVTKGPLQKL